MDLLGMSYRRSVERAQVSMSEKLYSKGLQSAAWCCRVWCMENTQTTATTMIDDKGSAYVAKWAASMIARFDSTPERLIECVAVQHGRSSLPALVEGEAHPAIGAMTPDQAMSVVCMLKGDVERATLPTCHVCNCLIRGRRYATTGGLVHDGCFLGADDGFA